MAVTASALPKSYLKSKSLTGDRPVIIHRMQATAGVHEYEICISADVSKSLSQPCTTVQGVMITPHRGPLDRTKEITKAVLHMAREKLYDTKD